MGMEYMKPDIRAYNGEEACELIGPAQANYLYLYFQQVSSSTAMLSNKAEQTQMIAKIEQPKIYKIG